MIRQLLLCLLIAVVWRCALSHHLRHHNNNNAGNSGDLKAALRAAESSAEHGSPKSRRSLQSGFYYREKSHNNNNNGSHHNNGSDHRAIPYSYKKLDKMMNKAILQIILGELHPADMLLLKALNYTLEDVMTIRAHELSRVKEEQVLQAREKKLREQELLSIKYQQQQASMRRRSHKKSAAGPSSASLETFNRQAVYDYENGGLPLADNAPVTEETLRQKIDKAMQSHVVFRIRHDDSEFDSASDERNRRILKNHRTKSILKLEREKLATSGAAGSFRTLEDEERADASAASSSSSGALVAAATSLDDNYEVEATKSSDQLDDYNKKAVADYENLVPEASRPTVGFDATTLEDQNDQNDTDAIVRGIEEMLATTESSSSAGGKGVSEYEGLEWVGGDIYRVKPEAMEALLNYEEAGEEEEETREETRNGSARSYSSILDELVNDTFEYQNDADDTATDNLTDSRNLTSYQQIALAQRRDQGQKAIEDIKLRVLALTGRFNLTSNNNQVQQRLAMFSPTCQVPRNTDPDAWSDPFSMNMHFQLNLTSSEHVLAAKLRLFKLPQENAATSTTGSGAGTFDEGEEEDEKKIRISVYFYTKSLKKHRVKKRLMDSVVTPLTSQGSHLALDVRQALRFWRPAGSSAANQQNQQSSHGHGGNHGLVVLVEDQDGRPLRPSLYIQEPTCPTVVGPTAAAATGSVADEKAYQFVPALFVRACTRYVRLVNGKVEMYVQCRPSQRH